MQSYKPEDVRHRGLQGALAACEREDWESAYDVAYGWLKINPDDADALNIICYIMLNTDKQAIAYPMLKRLCELEPENPLVWLNMGMAASDLWRYNEAIRAYKKGIKFSKNDHQRSMQCVNISSVMVDHGDFKEAEKYCLEAIRLEPKTPKGQANLGFCQLAQRNWKQGWKNYRYCMDTEWRPLYNYNDEPLWDGEKGRICIYSEQGLGDEISFGQMLPDMKKWCDENDSTLVVDVNSRLVNLLRRSFPDIEIHGTRSIEPKDWDTSGIEYSLPMAQLGQYFRDDASKFTGKPYLAPDPDRLYQWQQLFKAKKKPVIGIAWRGGIWKTAAKFRQLELEALKPLIESVDAHWVSLQYKPSQKEIDASGLPITEYPFCTLSQDYDDTVAMIAAMDMVIAMQTTVVHVAGGLGVPCWTFVPKSSQWRYGQEGEDFPWADSVRIIRQEKRGQWDDIIQRTGNELANYPGLSKAAGTDAPVKEDQLRDGSRKVRRTRKRNDRLNGDRPSA